MEEGSSESGSDADSLDDAEESEDAVRSADVFELDLFAGLQSESESLPASLAGASVNYTTEHHDAEVMFKHETGAARVRTHVLTGSRRVPFVVEQDFFVFSDVAGGDQITAHRDVQVNHFDVRFC